MILAHWLTHRLILKEIVNFLHHFFFAEQAQMKLSELLYVILLEKRLTELAWMLLTGSTSGVQDDEVASFFLW